MRSLSFYNAFDAEETDLCSQFQAEHNSTAARPYIGTLLWSFDRANQI